MLAILEPELQIIQISENVAELAGVPCEELIGRPLSDFLSAGSVAQVRAALAAGNLDETPAYLPPLSTARCDAVWEATIHRHLGTLLVQLERSQTPSRSSFDLHAALQITFREFSRSNSVRSFCQIAAEQVRRFTGFDRVMIYRFLPDESGQVIAESKREDLEPFLGLHYPASDIPQQARSLYLRSWLRFIVDTEAAAAAMRPPLNPVTGQPLDMSFAVLRSVSPVHVEYLRNMGVRASLSLSVIQDGKLWGLVACHHLTPKLIPHAERMTCELLAHMLSLQVGSKEQIENSEYIDRMRKSRDELLERIAEAEPFHAALVGPDRNALYCLDASGIALAIDGEMQTAGRTPDQEQLQALVAFLGQHVQDPVFSTDHLTSVYPPATSFQNTAAGVLGIRLGRKEPEFLLWFRPAVRQLVTWGGDPVKPVEASDGAMRLSPRKSFAAWQQTVEDRSLPWRQYEIDSASDLRRGIVEIILHKAGELNRLNQELKQSNLELDSFAYVASHDLKEPLRGIHNYSQILKRTLAGKLEVNEHDRLDTILRLTQRMDDLIESLLQYSRAGSIELQVRPTEIGGLVRQVAETLHHRLSGAGVTLSVNPLPVVPCDPVRVCEIFTNLVVNAVKYNESEHKSVEIGCLQEGGPAAFYVKDNGIGIGPEHHEDIFRIFNRLHGRDEYGGGTGAGLTIARKMVERHGGRIWLESSPRQGSTFWFTLEKDQN